MFDSESSYRAVFGGLKRSKKALASSRSSLSSGAPSYRGQPDISSTSDKISRLFAIDSKLCEGQDRSKGALRQLCHKAEASRMVFANAQRSHADQPMDVVLA